MHPTTNDSDSRSGNSGLLSVVLVIAALYLAREVFILLALAFLLAFILEPLAARFERLHLGKLGSAITSVLIALVLFGALAYVVVGQLGDLGKNLPQYEKNIHEKIQAVESGDGGAFGRVAKSFQDFRKDLTPTNPPSASSVSSTNNPAAGAKSSEVKPVPVEVRNPETTPLQFVRSLLGPVANGTTTLLLITILCIFFLAGREDLRARCIRIFGARNKRLTNHILGETGRRVGRYLLMQLMVNACYTIPIGLGLWWIGIPNPLLWGILSGLFRYIPYVGPWIAASMPLLIGWAITPGWEKPLLVLGLYGVIEIITANLIEPLLYGSSTGLTPLAVLLSAVFWTWVWGPVGLLLSMPLTVCLVSISRHVPQLELLDQLFGEPDPE